MTQLYKGEVMDIMYDGTYIYGDMANFSDSKYCERPICSVHP